MTPPTGVAAWPSCGTSRSSIRPAAAAPSCFRPMTCWNRATTKSSATSTSWARPTRRNSPTRFRRSFSRKISTASIFFAVGRDYATGALDSFRQSGSTARQALGEHRPRQLAGPRPRDRPGRFRLARAVPRRLQPRGSRVRLRDRQSALGTDEVAGTRVLLTARPGDCHRRECGQAAAACRQAGGRRSGVVRRYQQALDAADSLLTYCRASDQYPLTGKGDINTYAVFAELAYRLVAPARPRGFAGSLGHRVGHDDQGFFRGGRRVETADSIV